jgi:hypothetical protein
MSYYYHQHNFTHLTKSFQLFLQFKNSLLLLLLLLQKQSTGPYRELIQSKSHHKLNGCKIDFNIFPH